MPSAKEALGFPSRTAAVLALRAQGYGPTDIGKRLGIEAKTVSALECSARRTVSRRDVVKLPPRNSVSIDQALREALRPHARRRDLSVDALARRILENVAYGEIVDAVLDDEADQ